MCIIKSYTPDYVLRLQKAGSCRCAGCRDTSPLLQMRWKNQVRHSAVMSCDLAAREILCHQQPQQLHIGEAVAENLPELSAQLKSVNRGCLKLLAASESDPDFFLYQLSRLIRWAASLSEDEPLDDFITELLRPATQRQMMHTFAQQNSFSAHKLAALRVLGRLDIQVNVARQYRQRLPERLQKIRDACDEELMQTLRALRQEAEQSSIWSKLQPVFTNFLFWELYHNIFPGRQQAKWEAAFADLCQHYYNLKMLSVLAAQLYPDLDAGTIGALFAAWQRVTFKGSFSEEGIAAGLALLK